MPSLVIPAHNEEAVLGRTLKTVLADLEPDEVEVVVVCNGCTDKTSTVAASFAPRVSVIEIAEASKVAALNKGDAAMSTYPRIYLDADISLSSASLRRLISHLEQPGALSAEPVPTLDTTRSSAFVRAWYAVWKDLYGAEPGKIGSGVLGLSSAGRARFDTFPKITADDAYVRAHFGVGELVHVGGATSRVVAPRTLRDLIKIKTRSRLGSAELSERFPELWAQHEAERPPAGGLSRLSPRLWPLAPWYVALTFWIRRRAKVQAAAGDIRWERDDSSRF